MTIDHAYELADQYAAKTNGYVGIKTLRYNLGLTNASVEIDYVLSAQALHEPKSFRTLELLIERLEELLK